MCLKALALRKYLRNRRIPGPVRAVIDTERLESARRARVSFGEALSVCIDAGPRPSADWETRTGTARKCLAVAAYLSDDPVDASAIARDALRAVLTGATELQCAELCAFLSLMNQQCA